MVSCCCSRVLWPFLKHWFLGCSCTTHSEPVQLNPACHLWRWSSLLHAMHLRERERERGKMLFSFSVLETKKKTRLPNFDGKTVLSIFFFPVPKNNKLWKANGKLSFENYFRAKWRKRILFRCFFCYIIFLLLIDESWNSEDFFFLL